MAEACLLRRSFREVRNFYMALARRDPDWISKYCTFLHWILSLAKEALD
jgi:hypothetical protein